jgi:hypothetical protein
MISEYSVQQLQCRIPFLLICELNFFYHESFDVWIFLMGHFMKTFTHWYKSSVTVILAKFIFLSSFQVHELKFILKMNHMTQMPFTLSIADPSKYNEIFNLFKP